MNLCVSPRCGLLACSPAETLCWIHWVHVELGGHRLHRNSKTHCKRGHPFTKENTSVTTNGWRKCRACKNLRQRERYQPRGKPRRRIPSTEMCVRVPAGNLRALLLEKNAQGTTYEVIAIRIAERTGRDLVACRRVLSRIVNGQQKAATWDTVDDIVSAGLGLPTAYILGSDWTAVA